MARVTVEDCIEQVENRFALARLAGARARQLMNGAKPVVNGFKDKPTVLALREVATGRVTFDRVGRELLHLPKK